MDKPEAAQALSERQSRINEVTQALEQSVFRYEDSSWYYERTTTNGMTVGFRCKSKDGKLVPIGKWDIVDGWYNVPKTCLFAPLFPVPSGIQDIRMFTGGAVSLSEHIVQVTWDDGKVSIHHSLPRGDTSSE